MITLSDFVASEGSHILGCGLAAIATDSRGQRISLHHAATTVSVRLGVLDGERSWVLHTSGATGCDGQMPQMLNSGDVERISKD